MVWRIASPRFVIGELTKLRRWQRENEEATGGFRWRKPTEQEEAASVLEARLYGWWLYNEGETVASSLGGLYLDDCEKMLDWFNGARNLAVDEMRDWDYSDRQEATNKEWVPLEPFFEVHLRPPTTYRKTPTAQWLLVNGGEWAAVSKGDLYGHECPDFLAWLQDETDIPIEIRDGAR